MTKLKEFANHQHKDNPKDFMPLNINYNNFKSNFTTSKLKLKFSTPRQSKKC